ncbi:MAG: twin-arginine translocase subunit TatC [Gilvibacter sp.]
MAKKKRKTDDMSFLGHLEELRWHLIRSTIAIVVLGIVAFLAKDFVFNTLLFGPSKADFPTFRFLCSAATRMGFEDAFCFTELPFRVQSRTMAGQFSAHIWTSITAGFIVAFPFVLYEFWKFISPGLKRNERRSSRGFIVIASLLFFTGVLFGYYIVTPLSINFLGTYQVSEQVFNDFDLDSYIGLVRSAAVASGLIFELPIIIFFLAKIGLVTPAFLRKNRKYALVILLILSAIITPPDVASQIVVAIPLVVLYEISIVVAKVVEKRELKKQAAHG